MAWLRGLLFGLQFLVLFLGSLPSPAKCEYGGKAPPPSPLPHPQPTPPNPEYKTAPPPSPLPHPPPTPQKPEYQKAPPPSPLPPKPPKPEYSVSVEGVVYCRCNLPGYVKPKDASPLPGALVSFKCGRRSWSAKTDARGYFLINGKFPLHKDEDMEKYVVQCGKVHVVSTPLPACTVPEFLEHKGKGASVFYEKNIPVGSGYVALFSAGDLYLGPADSKMCHA